MDFDAWKMTITTTTIGFVVSTNTKIHGTATITMHVYVFIYFNVLTVCSAHWHFIVCVGYLSSTHRGQAICIGLLSVFFIETSAFENWNPPFVYVRFSRHDRKLHGIQFHWIFKTMETINCDFHLTLISIQIQFTSHFYNKMLKL